MTAHKTVAIIGNPNCGKTTLFNRLTGANQKVGNWPGVTVDKKQGQLHYQGINYDIIDLPGSYSLNVVSEDSAIDEKIVCEFIADNSADLYVNIVDAANLKRNLYLTLQLLEMGIPCIIAVNMVDIAKQRHIAIDFKRLQQQLGCPVVALTLSKNQGLQTLKDTIANYQQSGHIPPKLNYYPTNIASGITKIQSCLEKSFTNVTASQRYALAIRLLEQDLLAKQFIQSSPVEKQIADITKNLGQTCDEDSDILIADCRYRFIQSLYQQATSQQTTQQKNITEQIDKIVMHRWLGIPVFLMVMYLMFEVSMNIGTLLQPLFDISSQVIFIDGIHYLGHQIHLPNWITAILSQGFGLGINTVINFIPQIGMMFLCLAILEDSGYMARAVFVMDRFMQFVGLPGKSFVPLIIGFGCNVPAIMASRTLENRRDRIITCLMSPFMSCGARLAIFTVFAGAFFPHHGGFVIFSLYLIGILVAMLTGLIFRKTLLQGESGAFVLELPIYHVPVATNILRLMWQRLKAFVYRAGRYIVPICMIVGTLNAITLQGEFYPQGSPHSILSQASRLISPVLQPMGVQRDNWPATVGVITGVLAKEIVVGTLNTLYSQQGVEAENDTDNYQFWGGLKSAITETAAGFTGIFSKEMINPFTANEADHDMSKTAMGHMHEAFNSTLAAFSYLLFLLLYIPCISTLGALMREVGKGWAWLATGWSFNIAYSTAVLCYQIGTWFHHPLIASSWIVGILMVNFLFYLAMKRYSHYGTLATDNFISPGGIA